MDGARPRRANSRECWFRSVDEFFPAMKLGIATPVVTNVAGASVTWEKNASIEDIGRVAETADQLGYHHMTCSEHIGLPSSETARRGTRYWDPLATFGYVSARTNQIRFATMTLVLGYHHPLAIVKRYGTLDHVSGGRVILGLGVGSLKEEFDLLGAPFEDRGPRADDALRALRAALPSNEPAYNGEFYSFGGLTVDPCALQPHLPIWIGGRTKRSLRRAVTLADGWCPYYVSIDTAADWLKTFDVPPGFEVVMPADQPLDPVGAPKATEETLGALAAGGTTILSARFIHHSLDHYLEQIHALAELHGLNGAQGL
jgi:probable F420-dependent oxidoreductase